MRIFLLVRIWEIKLLSKKSIRIEGGKPRNFVAKDLRTPKYRMKVAESKKLYNRQSEKLLAKGFKIESI